MLDLIWQK